MSREPAHRAAEQRREVADADHPIAERVGDSWLADGAKDEAGAAAIGTSARGTAKLAPARRSDPAASIAAPSATLWPDAGSARSPGSVVHGIGPAAPVFPGPEALRASSSERCHQFGAPLSSPWHDPGELVGYIVNPILALECALCFISTGYVDKTDGRRGQAKQGICTRRDAGTIGVTVVSLTLPFH